MSKSSNAYRNYCWRKWQAKYVTKQIYKLSSACTLWVPNECQINNAIDIQVQIEKKGKNKSREEIFYQMKGFFLLRSVVGSVFL